MAVTQTTRLNIYRWSAGTDALTRAQMDASHEELEDRVAGYSQAASRPAAALAYKGFFHYSTTGQLSYCNGTAWDDIAVENTTDGNIGEIDGTASAGTSASGLAYAEHKHSIAAGAITNTMIDTMVATKLTGTINMDRIAANSVTVGKIEQVAAHGILARVAGTTGDLSELTASTNQVLGRGGSGNLAFTSVTNAMLAGSITEDKIISVNASVVDGELAAGNIGNDTVELGTKTTGNYAESVAVSGSGLDISGSAGEGSTFTLSHANTSPLLGDQGITENSGIVIEDITVDEFGHVTAVDTVNLTNIYYERPQVEGLFTDNTRRVYGISTDSGSRNSNVYRTVFLTSSEPTASGLVLGDLWINTSA